MEAPPIDYRSIISQRPGFTRPSGPITTTQTFGSMASGGSRIVKSVTEYGSSSIMSGGLSPFGQNAASTIRDTREREKKEMSDLNDRLASYIEKVRFLEAQNRKLAADLDLLRSRWGKDTISVRSMYEGEIQVMLAKFMRKCGTYRMRRKSLKPPVQTFETAKLFHS
ncbi:hypothetical protein AB6A40_011108 [Gnathostoma spinigerum]|uniref:IF rod domain-containing protein n=1 Tax=Gnathostoma spinigerum TaxID=75299 RepID=A0ABD6F155_9BILA